MIEQRRSSPFGHRRVRPTSELPNRLVNEEWPVSDSQPEAVFKISYALDHEYLKVWLRGQKLFLQLVPISLQLLHGGSQRVAIFARRQLEEARPQVKFRVFDKGLQKLVLGAPTDSHAY